MGSIICICSGTKEKAIDFDSDKSKEILVSIFRRNKMLYGKLIKLQARYKARFFRAKFAKEQGYQTPQNNFIPKHKINDDAIRQLFKKYSPLGDTYKVELRPPVYDIRSIYYGEWNPKTNQRHGRGIQAYYDGSFYEGYWRENKCNCQGKLIHSDGDIYEGEWLDDKAHGLGSYYHKNGSKYEGQWQNDKQEGEGKESWNDGSYYKGSYKNGKKNGFGRFCWADTSFYEGQFLDNLMHGKGRYLWYDGRCYEGDWKDGKMSGEGVFVWRDGRKYMGTFLNDKREGYGYHEWADGRKYRGFWVNGKRHGEGEVYNPKKHVWKKGVWVDDIRIKKNNTSTTMSNQVSI